MLTQHNQVKLLVVNSLNNQWRNTSLNAILDGIYVWYYIPGMQSK